jgi:hypothetical protein
LPSSPPACDPRRRRSDRVGWGPEACGLAGGRTGHNAAGFVGEHRRRAQRWDLAAIARDLDGTVALHVGGSDEDPYEHRQIPATRQRVPQAEVLTFPGGHLTASEHGFTSLLGVAHCRSPA